jgi:hypothetical protein
MWSGWACVALAGCGSRTDLLFPTLDDDSSIAIDASNRDAQPDAAIDARDNPAPEAGVQTTTLVLAVPGTANLYGYEGQVIGDTPPVLATTAPICPGTQLQVIASGCVVSFGPSCIGPDGSDDTPYGGLPVYGGLPIYSLIGQWGTSPKGLTAATVAGDSFFVGSNIVLAAPSEPGSYFLYLAENDGKFYDNSGAYSVTVTYAQDGACR